MFCEGSPGLLLPGKRCRRREGGGGLPSCRPFSFVPGPLPPLSYRPGVQGIMAIGIEPQAMAEGCLPREVLFGHAVQVVEEPTVRVLQLPQDFGERQVPFL